MSASSPLLWLLGEVQAPEVAPAVDWLRAHVRIGALDRSRLGEPDAIVFCLTRPGQFPRFTVENLHRDFPFSRLMALVGPWCEGEVRSGRPWPGVTRIYWHQWQTRLKQEIHRLAAPDLNPLPRSATEVDTLLSRLPVDPANRPSLIGIVAGSQSDFEAIAWGIRAGGHHPVRIVPSEALPTLTLDALVFDAGCDLAAAVTSMRAIEARLGPVPSIVLANFPRPDELAAIGQFTRRTILAKPFRLQDLLDRIRELLLGKIEDSSRSGAAA